MSQLQEILHFNEKFVQNKAYIPLQTSKFPDRKMVILSCMDTRLSELLLKAMNLKNGDAKILKTAGALISHPFGSVMRSILVALYELKAEEVYIIGHHECGMTNMRADGILDKMMAHGVQKETVNILENAGIDIYQWLHGFDSVTQSVKHTVALVNNHPLFPKGIPVHGLVIDPNNGKLEMVE